MKNNNKYLLYLGDCLDLMKDIPDKTIDLQREYEKYSFTTRKYSRCYI